MSAYREDRTNGIGSNSNRIPMPHQKRVVLSKQGHPDRGAALHIRGRERQRGDGELIAQLRAAVAPLDRELDQSL